MASAIHREMYRRGDFLTATARTSIVARRDALLEQQKTLKNYISDKTEALRAVEATFSFDAAFLAPIRSVPREILSHIFFLAREDYTSVFYDDTLIVIGQVCKLWRTLTRSTPTLWADLRIFIDEYRKQNTHFDAENIIHRACALSGRQLLDLTIVLPYFPVAGKPYVQEHAEEVVDVIIYHLSSWESLDYKGSFNQLKRIIQTAKTSKFPGLETLKLFCCDTSSNPFQADTSASGFSNVSRLETNFPPEIVATGWPNLTSFSGPFSDNSSCYDFLVNATRLSSLHVSHIPPSGTRTRPRSVLTLPHIQRLTINACAISRILDDLCLPNLKELATQYGEFMHEQLAHWPVPCTLPPSQRPPLKT